MHNHGEDKQSSWMMRIMILCCVLPLLLILIFGAGGKALGAPIWVIFGGIAVMVIVHFFMMGKSHKHSNEEHEITDGDGKSKDSKDNKNHSGHGCCH